MPKINPDALRAIVFVGTLNAQTGQVDTRGTAFIIRVKSGRTNDVDRSVHALVTTKHTLDEIRSRGGLEICVRFNMSSGGSCWKKTLIEDWNLSAEPNVDVAFYLCRIPPDMFHLSIAPELVPGLTESQHFEVQVTDDVAILGLFAPHHGKQSMIPVARLGTIAALSDTRETITATTSRGRIIEGIEAHLLEIRSIGGVSGSPVFAFKPASPAWDTSTYDVPSKMFLFGMISGHFPYTERVSSDNTRATDEVSPSGDRILNAGIAYATPVSKIVSEIHAIDLENHKTRLFFPLMADLNEGSLLYQIRNLKASEIKELSTRLQQDTDAIKRAGSLGQRLKFLIENNFEGATLDEVSSIISELSVLKSNDSVRASIELIVKSGFRRLGE